ncbi:MAG: biotin transporter BioY [Candidatus Latescibacteria bacterium]|jgi:biotin transport system substrate-specific component|nr:biotin transporter BioY [Candidatus Latescibacterota bacterium]
MDTAAHLDIYREAKHRLFRWPRELAVVQKVALALGFACLTGLSAQLKVYLPWTPVPVSGQTFAVLLGAVLLGRGWGGLSQVFYVGLGVAGVPWFAGWGGGAAVLVGPTGGYLLGFIAAAFLVGHVVDGYAGARRLPGMVGLMLFASFAVIYGLGLAQLYLWSSVVQGDSVGFWTLLQMGALPFLVGDLVKALVASAAASAVVPKGG